MRTKYRIRYCIKWNTKENKELITEENIEKLRNLFIEISNEIRIQIIATKIEKTKVIIEISSPPYLSVSRIVQVLKGKTSRLTNIKWQTG